MIINQSRLAYASLDCEVLTTLSYLQHVEVQDCSGHADGCAAHSGQLPPFLISGLEAEKPIEPKAKPSMLSVIMSFRLITHHLLIMMLVILLLDNRPKIILHVYTELLTSPDVF